MMFCFNLNRFVGDGYVCTGFDPCSSHSTSPLCHPMARCVYVGPNVTKCQCPSGYIGDGVSSCVMDGSQFNPSPSCARDHGGCAADAVCNEIRFAGSKRVNVTCTCRKGFAGGKWRCTRPLIGQIISYLNSVLLKHSLSIFEQLCWREQNGKVFIGFWNN